MRSVVLLSSLALGLAACSGTKTAPEIESGNADHKKHLGTVTLQYAKDGCPVLVELEGDAKGTYLLPIAMDTALHKEGAHISFNYRVSRASSGNCNMGQPVVLEDIVNLE